FVLLGAVPDPQNMPRALGFIAVLAVVGGAAWIAGMPSGRSNEYGAWGLVIGAAGAFVLTFFGNDPPMAVLANSGDLTAPELQSLRTRREIANQFVAEALRQTREPRELNQLMSQYAFNYDRSIDEDTVTAELLHREAERLGLRVPDGAVTDFIRRMTDGKISQEKFKEIRQRLHVSEPELYSILAYELEARMAAKFLYGIDPEERWEAVRSLPPEQFWDLYRRMHVKQRIEVAALPVKEFVDEAAQPTPEQLAELFDKYRNNSPLLTADGQVEEGRPGFEQPRRIRIASLEAVFDEYKPGIAPVTDAEIEQRYQEQYVKPAEEAAARAAARRNQPPIGGQKGPALPSELELQLPDLPAQPPAGTETPAGDKPADEKPAGETPVNPGTEPSPGDAPQSEQPPAADAPKPEETKPAPQEGNSSGGDSPAPTEGATEKKTEQPGLFSLADGIAEESASDAKPNEAASTETPATENKPAETPAAAESAPTSETPAADAKPTGDATTPAEGPGTETPAADAPAATPSETPPETATGTPGTPPAPQSNVPLLDDALKTQIRTALEAERTAVLMRKAIEEAIQFIDDKVAFYVNAPADDPDRITPEHAAELLQAYAAEHKLHYSETPLLSYQELQEQKDEYPVGAADMVDDPSRAPLVNMLFQTSARDTYRPIISENGTTQSWFAAWKTGEQAPYQPKSLDDERVREQVVKAWRQLQAREKAQARAQALVEIARNGGQSLAAALGETTVTGADTGLFIDVKETPEFSWLTMPTAQPFNPFAPRIPRIQAPPGVQDIGEKFMRTESDFMKTVFDDLKPGDVGVAANVDRSEYYVVRIVSRTPTPTDPLYAAFQQRFLREPVFDRDPILLRFGLDEPSAYETLAFGEMSELRPNWLRGPNGLWNRHEAVLTPPEAAAQASEE
ncbi:MAG: SurA N-terminal domain-containing protein, partial [Planctomycetaceae bacterium]